MNHYIELNRLKKMLPWSKDHDDDTEYLRGYNAAICTCAHLIDVAPYATSPNPPTAEWDTDGIQLYCTSCGTIATDYSRYCPYCGARMIDDIENTTDYITNLEK